MTTAAATPGRKFSLKAFLRGLALVVLLYGALAGYLWWIAPATLAKQQERLAAQTVSIAYPSPAPVASTPEPSQVADTKEVVKGSPPLPAGKTPPVTALPAITVTPAPPASTASAVPQTVSLPPAPLDGLFETAPQGRLPIVRKSDGMTPFNAYRRPFDRAAVKGPVISIAVIDLGLSDSALKAALDTLPPAVSFDVSPYAAAPDVLVAAARAKGHEIWLTLPLESEDYPRVDTGADTLLISAPPQQNLAKLAHVLGSAAGYAGLIASPNPAFLKSDNDARPILADLYGRGLGFVDTSETPGPLPQNLSLTQNAPYAAANIWLDNSATPDDIQAALGKLEQKAREHGSATGLIHPLPVSYREIKQWLETLPDKGITLAPLSAQADHKS
jgi:polysaccharide deacetylase 2 family uncharacterized protein YibQ